MFEQRGWVRTGLIEGPAPVAPSCLEPSSLLVWAERAPVNGAWLDAVAAVDPLSLSAGDRLALVRAWERLRRGVDAGFAAAVGAIAERPCRPEPGDPSCAGGRSCTHDWSGEDLGAALGVGRQTATGLLAHARELSRRLPGLLGEVSEGRASFTAARRAAERTAALSDDLAATVAEQIAGTAPGKTVGAFDRHVAAVIDRHRSPAEVAAAHQKNKRDETGIRPLQPMTDGMAGATLIGPAEQIAALFGWARRFTRLNRHPEDPRTVGQRRLDALLAALLHPAPTGPAAGPAAGATSSAPDAPAPVGRAPAGGAPDREAPRQRVALHLVLAASTLLGHDEDPGWLQGHGALAAPLARALAIHPQTIARLLAHPVTGHLLDLTPTPAVPLPPSSATSAPATPAAQHPAAVPTPATSTTSAATPKAAPPQKPTSTAPATATTADATPATGQSAATLTPRSLGPTPTATTTPPNLSATPAGPSALPRRKRQPRNTTGPSTSAGHHHPAGARHASSTAAPAASPPTGQARAPARPRSAGPTTGSPRTGNDTPPGPNRHPNQPTPAVTPPPTPWTTTTSNSDNHRGPNPHRNHPARSDPRAATAGRGSA